MELVSDLPLTCFPLVPQPHGSTPAQMRKEREREVNVGFGDCFDLLPHTCEMLQA